MLDIVVHIQDQLVFKNLSIFGRIFKTHLNFFESMLSVKKTNGNFSLREVTPHTAILWFIDYLCSSRNTSPGNTHISLRDSLYKNEIHLSTHILHYQQYKSNILKVQFYFS